MPHGIWDLDQSVRQTEFARLVGVSQPAIADLIQRGILDPDDSAGNWLHAYCGRLREQAAGRGLPSQELLNQAKIREANANADLKQYDYLQKIGAVVAAADIEPALAGWARVAKAEIDNALDRLVAALESQHNIEIEPALIDEYLAPAFSAIYDYPRDAIRAADPGGEGVGAAAEDIDPELAQ